MPRKYTNEQIGFALRQAEAGAGGIVAADTLRRTLPPEHQIALLDREAEHQFSVRRAASALRSAIIPCRARSDA